MRLTHKHYLPQRLRLTSLALAKLGYQSPLLISEWFALLTLLSVVGSLSSVVSFNRKSNYRTQSSAEEGWQGNGWDVLIAS